MNLMHRQRCNRVFDRQPGSFYFFGVSFSFKGIFLYLFIECCTTSFIEVQQSTVKSTQPRVSFGYKLVKRVDFDQSL